nr:MAG TPA: hypothetical protein [Caudoviricetes sp.]
MMQESIDTKFFFKRRMWFYEGNIIEHNVIFIDNAHKDNKTLEEK